jgi:uracil-DNA glycosylase
MAPRVSPRITKIPSAIAMSKKLGILIAEIKRCRVCEPDLPLGARLVLMADFRARILVAGQAPGLRVHRSGVPWDKDASSRRLCDWLGLSQEELHAPEQAALVPMGLCYPGKGRSGDLPPRPECRARWHDRLFKCLPNLQLRILVGQYAQAYHVAGRQRSSLTETVAAWRGARSLREKAIDVWTVDEGIRNLHQWLSG